MIKLPNRVKMILDRLEKAGREAYVVGGCVRDALLGREPHDWDICTAALPEEISELFRGFPQIKAGVKHGTVGIIAEGEVYEVTTFRTDGNYTDHRRPDEVIFIRDLEGDLSRRDFTVNAMAYSENRGLADPFGGRRDLERGILRCVGEPEKRFCEDALRIMRALRFAAVYGLTVEEKTAAAIHRQKGLLREIASERITEELRKLLGAEHPRQIAEEFADVLEQTPGLCIRGRAELLDRLPAEPMLRCAALMPRDFSALRQLRLSHAETSEIRTIAAEVPAETDRVSVKRLISRCGAKNAREILLLNAAWNGEAPEGALQQLNDILEKNECCTLAQLAIGGRELTAMGYRGRCVGELLKALLEEVLCGRVENTPEALKHACGRLKQ